MARIALSLIALFLSATYVVAGRAPAPAVPTSADGPNNLEAFCKKSQDVKSCVELLQPAVAPTTQFDSLEWYRKVLSKSLSKSIIAKSFMSRNIGTGLKPRTRIAVTGCVEKLNDSVERLQQVSREFVELYKAKTSGGFLYNYEKKNVLTLMNTATAGEEACYASMQGIQDPSLQEMSDLANKAYSANKIVTDLLAKF